MGTGRINIKTLAEELDTPVEQLLVLRNEKLTAEQFVGKGKNTWLTPEGAEVLRLAVQIPLAVPTRLRAKVIQQARNPRWVYVAIIGMENRHPVSVPSRFRGKLMGKSIDVEAITDATGTTYRYVT